MSCPSLGVWVARQSSLSSGIHCTNVLFLKDSNKQVTQMSMANILGRVGSISKWRGGANDFLRLLPVLLSVSLWLCQ